MSDPDLRHPDNAPGPVYVDDTCICCAACMAIAPTCFDDPHGDVVCVTQPATPAEWAACVEAASSCPVDAIGLGCDPPDADLEPTRAPDR